MVMWARGGVGRCGIWARASAMGVSVQARKQTHDVMSLLGYVGIWVGRRLVRVILHMIAITTPKYLIVRYMGG